MSGSTLDLDNKGIELTGGDANRIVDIPESSSVLKCDVVLPSNAPPIELTTPGTVCTVSPGSPTNPNLPAVSADGRVKMNAGDTLGYLETKLGSGISSNGSTFSVDVDNDTIVINLNKLSVDSTKIDHDVLLNFVQNKHLLPDEDSIIISSGKLAVDYSKIPTSDIPPDNDSITIEGGVLVARKVNTHTVEEDVPAGAVFTDTFRPISSVTTPNDPNISFSTAGAFIMEANVLSNTNHRLGDGSDHAFIDQAVTIASTPTFSQLTLSNQATNNTDAVRYDQLLNVIGNATWQNAVKNILGTPPLTPELGDRYIVQTGTGAWLGQDNTIAEWNSTAWEFLTPDEGWATYVQDDAYNTNYIFNGTSWVEFGSVSNHNSLGGIQGGTTNEHYHLTNAEQLSVQNDVPLNTTHRTSNGSDHTYIDQDVTASSSPVFVDVNADSIKFDTTTPPVLTPKGTIYWNDTEYTINIETGLGPTIQVGQELLLLYYNDTGVQIDNFDVLHLKGGFDLGGTLFPTPELADASMWEKTQGTLTVATQDIAPGSLGFSIFKGLARGGDTSGVSAGAQLWLSATNPGKLTDIKPVFPDYSISIGGAFNSTAAPNGKIFVNITKDVYDTFGDAHDGSFRESFNFTVSSNGTVITGVLANVDPTRNLTGLFSDGFYTFNSIPNATIPLIAGIDTAPQINYIYIPRSTKVLTVSTTGFPSDEHIRIADVLVISALSTQTDGAIMNRNWNDHLKAEDDNGHILHISERLRQNHAQWDSGTAGTCTVTGGTTIDVTVTGGSVYQLHKQAFPSFNTATGDHVHVVNNFTTPYLNTSNLETQVSNALGDSFNNSSYSWVLWGVQNKSGEASQLMINLPVGGYSKNSPELAEADSLNYSVYDIPNDFKGKGFLIARFTFINNGGVITLYATEDLRGKVPNSAAGGNAGGGTGVTEFLSLTDTPVSYIGQANSIVTVGPSETGLEFTAQIDLTSQVTGTLPDGNLSSNVTLLNAANTFIAQNTFDNGSFTPIIIARNGAANTNVNIRFDGGNGNIRYLGLSSSSSLKWGSNADSNSNSLIYHSGNSNLSTVPWNAQSISTNGTTRIDASGNFTGASGSFSDQLFTGSNGTNGQINLARELDGTFSSKIFVDNFDLILENTSGGGDITLKPHSGSFTQLWGGGSQKLATTSSGIDVTGNVKLTNAIPELTYEESDFTGNGKFWRAAVNGGEYLLQYGATGINASTVALAATAGADTRLFYNSSVKLATTTSGIDVTGNVVASGTVTATTGVTTNTGGSGSTSGVQVRNGGWVNIYNSDNTKRIRINHNGASDQLDIFDQTNGRFANIRVGAIISASTVTATNFILSSDERLKTFKDDEEVVDVDSIKIRKFVYNDDETKRDRYGVSAQELQKVAPEMVYEDSDEDKTLRVGYIDFLLAKISNLEERLNKGGL